MVKSLSQQNREGELFVHNYLVRIRRVEDQSQDHRLGSLFLPSQPMYFFSYVCQSKKKKTTDKMILSEAITWTPTEKWLKLITEKMKNPQVKSQTPKHHFVVSPHFKAVFCYLLLWVPMTLNIYFLKHLCFYTLPCFASCYINLSISCSYLHSIFI